MSALRTSVSKMIQKPFANCKDFLRARSQWIGLISFSLEARISTSVLFVTHLITQLSLTWYPIKTAFPD